MFPSAVRIVRIHGVDIRLDLTWVLVVLLVGWSFHLRFSLGPWSTWAVLAMAVGGTTGFFGSVLAHEMGHALEARHRGFEVHGVTLFLFGGVTEMEVGEYRPRDEFAVAAIGPWVSLVLASIFGLLAAGIDWFAGDLAAVSAVAGLLGWLNLGLAVFNLLPGAPLDGGRVLRAGLWALTGDRLRAVRLAARAGQVLAVALLVFGAWAITRPGGGVLALWTGAIGLFLLHGATVEHRQGRHLEQRAADADPDPAEVGS